MVYDFWDFLGEDCNTASYGGDLLPRLGRRKGYLDGLHKTSKCSVSLADFYNCLVIDLRYLGF